MTETQTNGAAPARTVRSDESIMYNVVVKQDLSGLSMYERARFLVNLCRSHKLNPLSRPIELIEFDGKIVPYANKNCSDQLRSIHKISIKIGEKVLEEGLYKVQAFAKNGDGREDEDWGIIDMPDMVKGKIRANKMLHCITKAKRRVTLSISGLGYLDQTETDTIDGATPVEVSQEDLERAAAEVNG